MELGLARSRSQASELIQGLEVSFRGAALKKPGQVLPADAAAEEFFIKNEDLKKYVSRGGLKLEGALDKTGLSVQELRALDVGISTGGFTDCLLQRGVSSVVGIDVGREQLSEQLKKEPRLKLLEGMNIKDLKEEDVGPVDLCVVDVSFISLTRVFPVLQEVLREGAQLLALVKPQFEVGKAGLSKGGLVKKKELYQDVEEKVKSSAEECGFIVSDFFKSQLQGGDGNVEFFLFARRTDR